MKQRPLLAALLALFLLTSLPARAEQIAVSNFAVEGITDWKPKSYRGTTEYTIVHDEGHTALKAHAKATASGLIKKLSFNPAVYRYLTWSWKIAGTVPGGNETTRQGNDFAARVYVIFPGRFFWQMKALTYIWANALPKGDFVANPYTSREMLIAVESGPAKAGQWLTEERDILADYRCVFGEDPPKAGGIAIMTDADNTGAEATGWYGDITLSTQP